MENQNVQNTVAVRTTHTRKVKYAAPIGGIFIVLAIIGLVAVIVFGIKLTSGLLDNTKEKKAFERVILPVLMFDPVPFESPQDADPLTILQSSLWATLLSQSRDKYAENDNGDKLVPASDVDVVAARLFGPEIHLQHQSFGNYDVIYSYDDKAGIYTVPVVAQIGSYTPRVEKISQKGDIYTLTVGYIPPGNAWNTDIDGTVYEPEPDKYMIYELKKNKDSYQILAIRDIPSQEIPTNSK